MFFAADQDTRNNYFFKKYIHEVRKSRVMKPSNTK